MPKKDPKFKRNLELLSQALDDYVSVRPRAFDDDPAYEDSFAFTFVLIFTEEEESQPDPFKSHPIKAA
ncbi:MAG: hypothetical protein K9K67_11700 [Bacteriovoracaceae bacterium]|nr:hypothetical protein [Bacteriovoracaceae bacterium]